MKITINSGALLFRHNYYWQRNEIYVYVKCGKDVRLLLKFDRKLNFSASLEEAKFDSKETVIYRAVALKPDHIDASIIYKAKKIAQKYFADIYKGYLEEVSKSVESPT